MKPKGKTLQKSPTPVSRTWLAGGILCLIALAAYSNSFDSGFVLDNRDLLLGDARVHQVTAENLRQIFAQSYWGASGVAGLYRPATTLSYLFNYSILGNEGNPAGYHWINLLLHAGNVLLLFALARRLVREFWPSFLIAALWAVHPVLTESVTNIVGRADLLAGMATLGGLLIYLKSAEAQGWQRVRWLAALTAVTTVGLFSKESAVAVAGIILLYELTWWNPARLRAFLMACGAMAAAFGLMLWARSRVLGAEPPADFPFVDNPIMGADFLTGRLTAVKVMAKYLGLLIWPANLSVDYSYNQIALADGCHVPDWISWGVVAAAVAATALLYRRSKPAFFAAGFAFLALLPASNLVVPVGTIMAERFLYLPAAGFAICLTLSLYTAARRLRLRPAAALSAGLLIATAFAARTQVRNDDWRDEASFAMAAVRSAPQSFKTHMWSAAVAARQGLASGNIEPALSDCENALAIIDPLPDRLNNAAVYYRAGMVFATAGEIETRRAASANREISPEGAARYRRARTLLLRSEAIIRSRPEDAGKWTWRPDLYLASAKVDQRLGNSTESMEMTREAQTVAPLRAEVYAQMDDLLQAEGRREEGLEALVEGTILTGSDDLRQKLVAEYAGNPEQMRCAVSYAHSTPELNTGCPMVRNEACATASEVLRLGRIGGGPGLQERLRSELATKYGCNP